MVTEPLLRQNSQHFLSRYDRLVTSIFFSLGDWRWLCMCYYMWKGKVYLPLEIFSLVRWDEEPSEGLHSDVFACSKGGKCYSGWSSKRWWFTFHSKVRLQLRIYLYLPCCGLGRGQPWVISWVCFSVYFFFLNKIQLSLKNNNNNFVKHTRYRKVLTKKNNCNNTL